MKAFKTRWFKDGVEIPAYVQIKEFIVSNSGIHIARAGRGGGGGSSQDMPEYTALLVYVVTEDAEGQSFLSEGNISQVFNIDHTDSVKGFIKFTLKNLAHLDELDEI